MKAYFTLFIILTIFSALQAQDDCGKLNKKYQKSFDEALQNIDIAKRFSNFPERQTSLYREANMSLKTILDAEPDYAPVHYYLGYINIYKPDNNLTAAEKYLKKCIELCPDGFPDAYYLLGKLYFSLNKKEEAANYLGHFLKEPDKIEDDSILTDAQSIYKWAIASAELKKAPVPFNPQKVNGISSKEDEYLVIISPDNELALYTRKTELKQSTSAWSSDIRYKEKFFFSKRSGNIFDNGQEMPAPFNMQDNEGGATLTIDNKELIYTVCKMQTSPKQYYNCDLYYTHYSQSEGWSDIQPLPNVNTPNTWETMPSISSDGKTLYFISDRPGGIGGYDIYKSTRDESGVWTEPVNLGKSINTKGNEKSPFIHTDSQTLYFSSDGCPGMGGYDIFFSKMNNDGSWQTPKNIGYPINNENDDVGFIVSTDGKYGYFASNNPVYGVPDWNFYSFELYPEARPEKVLFIKGSIKNEETKELVNAKLEIKNLKSKKVTSIPVDVETGTYVAALPFNSDYLVTVKSEDFVFESELISQDDTSFNTPKNVDVELKPIELGKAYKMNDIYYETSSSELKESSLKVLDEFCVFLNENPKLKIAIHGHTDNMGNDDANMILSQQRAKSVYDYLITKGIDSGRLEYQGFGETKPVADNKTESGRAMNRRTEFVIIGK